MQDPAAEPSSSSAKLTHLDEKGAARMVDVGGKPVTARRAVAEGYVAMRPATLRAIADDRVLELLRLAGGLLGDNAAHVACCRVIDADVPRSA